MIIWKGLGFLILLLSFGSLVLTEVLTRAFFPQEPHYYQTHGWPKLAAFWFAALLVYLLSRLPAAQPGEVTVDNGAGIQYRYLRVHHLFFIPLAYWTYILLMLGIAFSFVIEDS